MIFVRILLILLLQTGVLFSMVYNRAEILEHGKTVILRTEPVDPRSLFRGYYVDLNYEISRLELADLEGDQQFDRWDTVFITLEQRDTFWAATGVYKEMPTIIGNQVVIKGVTDYVMRDYIEDCIPDAVTSCTDDPVITSLSVEYGIESYFIPEGDGASIEEAIREEDDRVSIKVAVNEDGRAVIKGLLMDGQLLYEEPPY